MLCLGFCRFRGLCCSPQRVASIGNKTSITPRTMQQGLCAKCSLARAKAELAASKTLGIAAFGAAEARLGLDRLVVTGERVLMSNARHI